MTYNIFAIVGTRLSSSISKFLGCRDPRSKHEYLDSGQIVLTITEGEENVQKSAKGCLVKKVTNIYKHEIVDTRA